MYGTSFASRPKPYDLQVGVWYKLGNLVMVKGSIKAHLHDNTYRSKNVASDVKAIFEVSYPPEVGNGQGWAELQEITQGEVITIPKGSEPACQNV